MSLAHVKISPKHVNGTGEIKQPVDTKWWKNLQKLLQ